MNDMTAPRAQFTHMKDGTGEDWQIIAKSFGDLQRPVRSHHDAPAPAGR